ncbi:hypothetical protein BDV33DRAFT_175047 [Aspergillus novoparasiticus]|uniref:Secreted protein n=1 Tax=Aspergillus novoparasiticus TaxID=986946 RepID=A0A5N6ELV9_9EURO|nr:hypothetical protein BDV33DRAFT_175047 [Aspergillus novoparasiticus]
MHAFKTISITSLFLIGVLGKTNCDNGDGSGRCHWRGTAPFCQIGDNGQICQHESSNRYWLSRYTKYDSVNTLLQKGYISKNCYDAYGSGCLSGSKYLWFGSEPAHCKQDNTQGNSPSFVCPIDFDHAKGYLEQGSAFVLSDGDQAQPIDVKNLISIDAIRLSEEALVWLEIGSLGK